MQRLALALLFMVVLTAGPASALIQPRLLDWQARLSRLLPERARTRALAVAERVPVTAMPADLQAALSGVAPGVAPEPVELYAGIRVLQRRDEVLARYEARVGLLEESLRILQDYERSLHDAIRVAPDGPPGPPLPPAAEGLPEPQLRPEGVYVFRLLPYPTPATSRARLRQLLAASEEDQARVDAQGDRAREGREEFAETTLAWRWHLLSLSNRLDPVTGEPGLPVMSLPACAEPTVEQIPPPPPMDLPPLPDTQEVDPTEPDEARPPSAPDQRPPGEERPSPPGGSGTEGGSQ